MRIGIDARFYGSVGKGLGRYTQKLIENLEKIDNTNHYFVFLRKENFGEYQPKSSNFKKILADYHWYTLNEQVMMPKILNKYDLDLVHFPHFNIPLFYRKKFIVTIHDLILLHFPTVRGTTKSWIIFKLKFLFYKIVINSAIKRAKKIITVSNFTKKDVISNYKVAEKKIVVTYEASDDFFRKNLENKKEILKKYDIMKPYIMYVGNAYPHKNLERLVSAFQGVKKRKSDLKLVLVGKEDFFYKKLKEKVREKKTNNIIFTGFVPDCELDTVYSESELYVFPSLYEGFGIPPLEAMARGVPVVSSNHECMKEILGDSAYYFDGKKASEIKKAIIRLLEDADLRRKLIEDGYKQVLNYDWKKMAIETKNIYLENA